MASLEYYNNVVAITDIFYDNSKTLIEKVCIDLDAVDRVDEMIEKYLDSTIKLKAKRDPNKPKRPKKKKLISLELFTPNRWVPKIVDIIGNKRLAKYFCFWPTRRRL